MYIYIYSEIFHTFFIDPHSQNLTLSFVRIVRFFLQTSLNQTGRSYIL